MRSAEEAPIPGIPRSGDILVGKYRVERVLGVGGMGAVVSATHLQLEEKVALKFLHAASALDAESVARFLREGKAVIKIRSEHAVKVHDVGRLDNGAPYLVMEHLDGADLSTLLEQQGAMPAAEAVDYVLQACEAIAEAHTLGIVHRDLKPANLFLTRRADGSPCVKVLDFGISKTATGSEDVRMTKTQAVLGSPSYMSPEQMRSTRATDGRTDIWSLGVILYELLSGRLPFVAQTMTELCAQILQDTPRPLPESVSAIDAIVQRCMAKDPNDRFASLAELAVALAPFGTASAQASAQRIVGVMNARLGGPGSTGPRSSVPSVTGGAASAVSQRAPSMGTDPTAVHAALPSLGATTPEMSAKGSPVVAVAVGATILVAGMIATAAFVTMGGKSNGAAPAPASVAAANTTSAAALPVAIPAVATSASVSGTPSSSVAPATPAPTSAVSAAAPKPSSAPAPPTHKHAPPRSSEEGMFDGRK